MLRALLLSGVHDTHMRDRSKCNRASPCDTCVKRNQQSSCEYADNAVRNQLKQTHRSTGDRLQDLENIVLQFVQKGGTGPGEPQEGEIDAPSESENESESERTRTDHHHHPGSAASTHTAVDTRIITPPDERGTLHVQGGQVNYVDSSHWLSILHDIKEVREQLSLPNAQGQEDGQSFGDIGPSPQSQPEAELVFGGLVHPLAVDIGEIIRSLPPRPVCDSLLSQYFNSQYMIIRRISPSHGNIVLYLSF